MAAAVESSKLIYGRPSRFLLAAMWLVGLIAYIAAIYRATDAAAIWINNFAWTMAPAAASLACIRTALVLDRHNSSAWWLFAAGCLSWLIGQVYWDYNQLVLGIALPFPNIGQLFYSGFPLLTIAAIARMPEYPQGPSLTLKHIGNVALVSCCLAVTMVLGLLEPALRSSASQAFLWVGGANSLLIATVFLYALCTLWTYRWSSTWIPMLLVVIACGIYSVTNLTYARSLLTETYLATGIVNGSYLVVFGLIAVSATERLWAHRHPSDAPSYRLIRRERWLEAVVPALLIIIMVVVAVSSSETFRSGVMRWSAGLFVLFAIVLGAREAWMQNEAQRLTNELLSTNDQLQKANTELRNSEARYRDLNTALEVRVTERTAQLERAYAELEGFSYAVAHDLKAPLRAINSFAHLLREEVGDSLDDRTNELVNRIRGGSLKMAALIDDLLAYSHIERRDLHLSQVRLDILVHEMLALYADEMQRRKVRLDVNIEPIGLYIDAEGLSLALRNLLENALKYTRDANPPHISITARQASQGVLLVLADNGIGFDMQYHDHIFKVFQRLHRDDEFPGTGIGLALVRKAIERLGGKVWAQSEPGKGAKFFVELESRSEVLGSRP